jgi:hypothetical protein
MITTLKLDSTIYCQLVVNNDFLLCGLTDGILELINFESFTVAKELKLRNSGDINAMTYTGTQGVFGLACDQFLSIISLVDNDKIS